jgi:hypothetical protein
MANTLNYPKLNIQVEGKGSVTDIYSVEVFNPTSKLESKTILNSSKGYVSIFSSVILPIRKIILDMPYYNSSAETAYTVNVRTTFTASGTSVQTEESLEGIIVKNYPSSFGATITNIEISTNSTTDRTIKSSIYSW